MATLTVPVTVAAAAWLPVPLSRPAPAGEIFCRDLEETVRETHRAF